MTGQQDSAIPDHNGGSTAPVISNAVEKDYLVRSVNVDKPSLSHFPRDIGAVADAISIRCTIDGAELESVKQLVLKAIKEKIGSKQVKIGTSEFAPEWVLNESIESELHTN